MASRNAPSRSAIPALCRSRSARITETGVRLIVFVAEVPGAHDATRLVLDLQEREPGEPHGVTGVVEQVAAVASLHRGSAELVVLDYGVSQRAESERDPRALPIQVRADHRDERGHPLLVFRGHTVRHHCTNPPSEHCQRDEHHGAESEKETGAKGHGGGRRGGPSPARGICVGPPPPPAWGRAASSGAPGAGGGPAGRPSAPPPPPATP